jgi:hypothetical protein
MAMNAPTEVTDGGIDRPDGGDHEEAEDGRLFERPYGGNRRWQ